MRIYVLLGFVICLIGGMVVGSVSADLPSTVNWAARGAVPPVRDQRMCGGDFAFAAAGAVDSLEAIFGEGLASVSEQQLLDCTSAYGGKGCAGASLDTAFDYIVANGITTSQAYPLTGSSGTCKVNGGAIKIKSYTEVPRGDCKALEAAVARQPVMAVVDALNWESYHGGIFSSCTSKLNHAVLVVGYTPEYWIVQNSWGTTFGEQGYIRLKKGNTCGICELAAYPNH
jgi:C1A family cysteine protease